MPARLISINQPEIFQAMLRSRPMVSSGPLQIFCQPAWPQRMVPLLVVGTAADAVALGVITPKRALKRAVHRNLVKRWVKSLVRAHAGHLAGFTVVFRVRSTLVLDTPQSRREAYASVLACFDALLARCAIPDGAGPRNRHQPEAGSSQ